MCRPGPCLPTVLSAALAAGAVAARPDELTLERLVAPTTLVRDERGVVPVALYFFVELESLAALFEHIDGETGRFSFESEAARLRFADRMLRHGLESRVVSTRTELPRRILLEHSAEKLTLAIAGLATPEPGLLFRGRHWSLTVEDYLDAFSDLRERWRDALNCWSGSPSPAGRALSNWHLIDEGIDLYDATWDSTEHFWQAVKYPPQASVADVAALLGELRAVDWSPWVLELAAEREIYFERPYAVEFLRHNLDPERLRRFAVRLDAYGEHSTRRVRRLLQRGAATPRLPPLEVKTLWGDVADIFHLIHHFDAVIGGFEHQGFAEVRSGLARHGFDGIRLRGYRNETMAFIGPDFRQLMLEIWKVKFLDNERLRQVIRSTRGLRLRHFVDGSDPPDIPMPVYVEMLERVRAMALRPGEGAP